MGVGVGVSLGKGGVRVCGYVKYGGGCVLGNGSRLRGLSCLFSSAPVTYPEPEEVWGTYLLK